MNNVMTCHNGYSYRPLQDELGSVRLLTVLPAKSDNSIIQCKITNGNIYKSRYKALSYVWGSPDSGFPILLDAQPVLVRKSLYNFLLKSQRTLTEHLLWIDALCINQNNIAERNSQVQQMSALYQNADTVLVWLEDAIQAYESDLIDHYGAARHGAELSTSWLTPRHEWKTEWTDFSDREAKVKSLAATTSQQFWYEDHPDVHNLRLSALQIPSAEDIEMIQRIIVKIATHPYWQRAWILQEFYQGQDLQLITEASTFPVTYLVRLYAWLKQVTYDAHSVPIEQMQTSLFYCKQYSSYLLESEREDEAVMDLQQGLQNFGIRGCADVRDRIFSLVGMCDKRNDDSPNGRARKMLQVDYNQTRLGVFAAAVNVMTNSRNGGVLNPWDAGYCELLVEALEISREDLENVFLDKTLPAVRCQYRLDYNMRDASDTNVLMIQNNSQPADKVLRCCSCLACENLAMRLDRAQRFVLVRLQKLWLITREVDDKMSLEDLEGVNLQILACVREIQAPGHNQTTMMTAEPGAQLFMAFAPQTLIQNLLCRSHITLERKQGYDRLRAILHLDEKSLLVLPVACRDGKWDGDINLRGRKFRAGLDEPPHELHVIGKTDGTLDAL